MVISSSHPWAPTRTICVLLFVTLIGYSNGWFWDQPSPTIEPKLAETIVKSPEDIDSSVMLNRDKHEEQRKRREADIHLLRTLKPLPMEKRSMTKEQFRKIVFTNLPNETHEERQSRLKLFLFNWVHGTNLTHNPSDSLNTGVRRINVMRRDRNVSETMKQWRRHKRAPTCINNCPVATESSTPIWLSGEFTPDETYLGYMNMDLVNDTDTGCATLTVTCYAQDAIAISRNTVNGPLEYGFDYAPTPGGRTSMSLPLECTEWGWGAATADEAMTGTDIACESAEFLPTTTTETSTTTTTTMTTTTTPSTSTT
ncbi:hypothetical protein WR25_08144, partial [Diploscapter pachys]